MSISSLFQSSGNFNAGMTIYRSSKDSRDDEITKNQLTKLQCDGTNNLDNMIGTSKSDQMFGLGQVWRKIT